MLRWLALLFLISIAACGKPAPAQRQSETPVTQTTQQENAAKPAMDEAAQIAALIDPAKLATLKVRGANPRILKITAILHAAKSAGKNPETITKEAVASIGWSGTDKGRLTAAAILKNLDILDELGSTTPEDIAAMRKGQSPTVRLGSHKDDIVSVDHIIPVAAAPKLSNTIANLELMPLRANKAKNDSIGDRQRDFARQLHAAGLLENPTLPN